MRAETTEESISEVGYLGHPAGLGEKATVDRIVLPSTLPIHSGMLPGQGEWKCPVAKGTKRQTSLSGNYVCLCVHVHVLASSGQVGACRINLVCVNVVMWCMHACDGTWSPV